MTTSITVGHLSPPVSAVCENFGFAFGTTGTNPVRESKRLTCLTLPMLDMRPELQLPNSPN